MLPERFRWEVVLQVPLLKGKEHMDENIAELMAAYKAKGRIGKAKPKNKAHALKIAIAIASDKAREK